MNFRKTPDELFAATAAVPVGSYIDGSWGGISNGTFPVYDPSNGEVLAEVANSGTEDATRCVDAAQRALPGWAATAPRVRAEILRRAFDLMIERLDWLTTLIVLENGKTWGDALGEARYAAEFLRWYSEEAVRDRGLVMTAPSGDNRIMVLHQPIGVAALVTPWNFPAAMLTRKIAPALAAGCSVVCKPASETPLTALAMVKIFEEAGVPAGVINIAPTTSSAKVVATWLADDRVRKLSFTGSTEVGRVLLRSAADRVISCSMELGGNAPFLVFDDADIPAAVAGAMVAKMRNGGEACTAANRFYVHERVAEEFSAGLASAMSKLSVGPGLANGVDLGPLINQGAREKVVELVEDARDNGGRVLTGGVLPQGDGWFYPPTVVVDVQPGAAILRNEIFGPVAPVVSFSSEEEAIRLANDSEMGLVSYVFTGDVGRGLRVSEALESGMVGLNRGLVSDPAAPFGGTKQSGLGREGGYEGMQEYMEQKYIALSW